MKFNNRKNRKQIGKRITALGLLGVMLFSSGFQSLAATEGNVEKFNYSKTAKVKSWDDRTYEINITAAAETVLETTPLDTYGMLVLDKSSSMFDSISDSTKYPEQTQFSELNTNYIYDYGNSNGSGFSYYHLKHLIVYRNGSWKVYKQSTSDVGEWLDDRLGENYVPNISYLHSSRFDYLREVVVNYINGLVSTASDSKLGIVVFPSDKTLKLGLTDVSSDTVDIVLNLRSEGQGSRLGAALKETYLQFFTESTEEGTPDTPKDVYNTAVAEEIPMYVIAVSDGNINDKDVARQYASKLKENNITVHTVITDFRATQSADKELMREIASPGCSHYTTDAADLNKIFNQIKQEYVTYDVAADVVDYIDNRFMIIDESGKSYDPEIGVENEVDYTYDGKDAKVGRNSKGLYIRWDDQNIGEETSNWKVLIKAREDYLGGNNVETNLEGSAIFTTNKPEGHPLTIPTVNVKADLNVNDHVFTIYKGEKVPTNAEVLNKLFDRSSDSKYSVDKFVEYGIMDSVSDTDPITLNWYSDADCTTPVTLENIQNAAPTSTATYYLKVSYDAGIALDDAKTNTTLSDGTVKFVGDEGTGILAATNGNKEYGTYTINVWELIKRNALDKNVLGNAEFTISKDGKTYYGKSDETGFVAWFTDNGYTTPATAMDAGTYTLTETAAPTGYTLNTVTSTLTKDATTGWTVPSTGGIIAEVDANKAYVDNTPTSDVTVKKIVDGNLGETTRDFVFTAVLKDANDQIVDFPEVNAKKGKVNADKSLTFDLEHNEEFVFEDLVVGYTIEITETKATVHDGNEYVLTVDGHDTFTGMTATKKVPFNQNPTITFKNTRQANILTGVVNNTPILPIMMLAIIAMALVVFKIRLNNERARRLADARSLRK